MKLLVVFLCAAGLSLAAMVAPPPLKVTSLARDFADFLDTTQGMPSLERVSRFKQTVAARYPTFYGVARYDGERTQAEQDAIIARTLDRFGPQRAAYLATVDKFDAALPRHAATFQATFPDFVPIPTYFLHSLNEMDGGTRDFDGSTVLIFGADLMARLHGGDDEGAFFHHELFHTCHRLAATACPQPGMWQPLWQEGLAVHVSKVLNPRATEKEMLFDFPARELGKTRDVHALAAFDCNDAHKLVVETVQALQRASAHSGSGLPIGHF